MAARGIASSFTLAWVVLRTMVVDFGILSHTLTTLLAYVLPLHVLMYLSYQGWGMGCGVMGYTRFRLPQTFVSRPIGTSPSS